MSLRVLCPNGHELVAEVAHIGRKIRCPACKVVMIVPDPKPAPAPAPPPVPPQAVQKEPSPLPRSPTHGPLDQLEVLPEGPPEGYFDDDRPRKTGMKTGQRMRLANIGLGFHYAKVLCWLVSICTLLFSFTLLPLVAAGALGLLHVIQVLSCISWILVIITPILGATGSLLCFWLPQKSRSRVLVIVSFGLEVGGTLLAVLAVIVMMTGTVAAAGEAMGGGRPSTGLAVAGFGLVMLLLAVLAILASFVLFLLVLRALAYYLRDRSTAEEAMRQLIMYLAVFVGGPVVWFVIFFVMASVGGQGGAFVMLALTLAWVVAQAMVLFAILNVISTLRQAIATRW
jgi:hypothetical protein